MGRTNREQQALAKIIADAESKVIIGAKYRHYKSVEKVYRVLGLGFMEANDELCVIYQAQYGERLTFVRPLDVWLEQVDWLGRRLPRFTQITDDL